MLLDAACLVDALPPVLLKASVEASVEAAGLGVRGGNAGDDAPPVLRMAPLLLKSGDTRPGDARPCGLAGPPPPERSILRRWFLSRVVVAAAVGVARRVVLLMSTPSMARECRSRFAVGGDWS